MPSQFINHGEETQPGSIALLQLKRDLITPVHLSSDPNAVLTTRFGDYPHKTLLGIPWGSQVLASKTKAKSGRGIKKRKTEAGQQTTKADGTDLGEDELVILGSAGAGFAHVLPPTPEGWTRSLPHRTQVVYTPDYSYVLQRLRVRPGSVIIEAGAGSGSFTHAAARAVYRGREEAGDVVDPAGQDKPPMTQIKRKAKGTGKVYSFEYHEPRAEQLQAEICEHGLVDVVTVTHRDVYEHGFNLPASTTDGNDKAHPQATAVFLDLPAPWLALKHLVRVAQSNTTDQNSTNDISEPHSPLDPNREVHICTFSPCIEQVQQTVTELARLGWASIETVVLAHHDVIARRERVGLKEEGSRDGNPMPATVEEAVAHLQRTRECERDARAKMFERDATAERPRHAGKKNGLAGKSGTGKEKRIQGLEEMRTARKLWKEGRLVVRTEPELKGHTSFLTFAVLPRLVLG